MRWSGATLQQIADRIGRTKERVRQILVKGCGTTKRSLMSTEQLCKRLGLPRNRLMHLYEGQVISPVAARKTETRLFLLWAPATADQVVDYYRTNRLCRICHRPVPRGRWSYCSVECLKESHKYRYRSAEARQRHIESVRRYKEKQKRLMLQATVERTLEHQSERLVLSGIAR
jgi:hypothetical protein